MAVLSSSMSYRLRITYDASKSSFVGQGGLGKRVHLEIMGLRFKSKLDLMDFSGKNLALGPESEEFQARRKTVNLSKIYSCICTFQ